MEGDGKPTASLMSRSRAIMSKSLAYLNIRRKKFIDQKYNPLPPNRENPGLPLLILGNQIVEDFTVRSPEFVGNRVEHALARHPNQRPYIPKQRFHEQQHSGPSETGRESSPTP